MSITVDNQTRSEASESELSEPLNTTAFDTATRATVGDAPSEANGGDFIEMGGKTYISVPTSAQIGQGVKILLDLGPRPRASTSRGQYTKEMLAMYLLWGN